MKLYKFKNLLNDVHNIEGFLSVGIIILIC